MDPCPNPFKTHILRAPANDPHCGALEVCEAVQNGIHVLISAWEPTAEELAALNRGERVWLYVYTLCHPMVTITAGERPAFLGNSDEDR